MNLILFELIQKKLVFELVNFVSYAFEFFVAFFFNTNTFPVFVIKFDSIRIELSNT